MSRILLVDDDVAVLSGLRRAFSMEGYDVVVAADGEAAVEVAEREEPDLIVLDIMLPRISGLEVCRRVRQASSVPILMLTARDTLPDRVAGLDRGADDYLVKPFALEELMARVRALLRRARHEEPGMAEYDGLRADIAARQASLQGEPLALTRMEFDLLVYFIRNASRVLSREQICQQVWGYAFEGASNFVDVAVMELRKKLEAGGHPRLIQTVRGYGYALREA